MEKTKNCWVIPTDKPSRLHLYTDEKGTRLETCELEYSNTRNTQHIYITSDEEIKEGDWVKLFVKHIDKDWIHKITKEDLLLYTDFNNEGSKIILTTDGDLIKDGVQSIDDEFLEWFVKNPSCEEVETYSLGIQNVETGESGHYKYEIIIPQEEPKQETLEEAAENYGWRIKKNTFSDRVKANELADSAKQDFIEGANYQAERMYSESIEFAEWIRIKDFQTTHRNTWIGLDMKYYTTEELFEQFKKK